MAFLGLTWIFPKNWDWEIESASGNSENEVDVACLKEHSKMANLLSTEKISTISDYFDNSHQTDSTGDDSSSTSEIDSLELNKTVSQQMAFFKSLSMANEKNSKINTKRVKELYNKKINGETVIEKEIRLQREREEAVAKERKLAQLTAISNQHNEQENCIFYDANDFHQDFSDRESNSVESLDVELNNGDLISEPKKEIMVRPVINDELNKPINQVLKESPVEREIRQSLEREAELKKEKGLLQANENLQGKWEPSQLPTEQISDDGNSESNLNHSIVKSPSLDKLQKSLQKKLAVSRLQQEIEEQTKRELVLQAEGAIKNTSEKFVDGWVLGRINSIELSSLENKTNLSATPPPLESDPNLELRDKGSSSPQSPVIKNGINSVVSEATDIKLMKRPNGIITLPRRNAIGKGVMQKFLSEKGKMSAQPFANNNKYEDKNEFDRQQFMDEIRKPPPKHYRRSYSAQSKISAELQQMKAREDELRLVRAKQMALSQPNLLDIGINDSEIEDENESTHSYELKKLSRANSNPNLLDNTTELIKY